MCGDGLKAAAAAAMHSLWESWLAWKDAEEATIAGIEGPVLNHGCGTQGRRQAGELACQPAVPS